MIYLASKSERRRELLTKAGISFKVVSSTYRERATQKLKPAALVMAHSIGKAFGAKVPQKNRWILGSDTVVATKDKILGKPKNRTAAKRMLQSLAGRVHYVYSGVCFYHPKKKKYVVDFVRTKVYMKRLSSKQIEEYYKEVNPLDKAGAYAIQAGPKIVTRIEGSYSNVVGLPMELVQKMLKIIV